MTEASEKSMRKTAIAKATSLLEKGLNKGERLAAQHEYTQLSSKLSRARQYAATTSANLRAPSQMANDAPVASTSTRPQLPTRSSFQSVRGYFSAANRELRNAAHYTDERCVCFPGYAVVRKRNGTQMVEVETSGFVFRTRPLNQANRTQRIFVSMAKQLAGLKALPVTDALHRADSFQEEDPPLIAGATTDFDPKDITFARLLALGNLPPNATDEEIEAAVKGLQLTDEPETMSVTESQPSEEGDRTPLSSSPETQKPLLTRKRSHSFSVDSEGRPAEPSRQRAKTLESGWGQESAHVKPPQSMTSWSSSRSSSINSQANEMMPFGSATANLNVETDLVHLHQNLKERLRVFFSQKLDGRRIRIAVYLLPYPNAAISDCRCLARGTVTSTIGGGFKSISTFPAMLEDTKESLEHAHLMIQCELLPVEEDSSEPSAPGRIDSSTVKVHSDNVIRILSDIDDTCKHTQVLKGIRTVFRNVFTLPYDRIAVPGMSEWYQKMCDMGASIHYVSNGPWELSEVVKDFMSFVNLPPGQIKLKEYVGSGSLLSDMWSSPAARKRGNVEELLKAFPDSKFLLIGDSGEQDLELYSSLASQYPNRVLAIFIRDVTTPLSISAADIQRHLHASASVDNLHPTKAPSRVSRLTPSRRGSAVNIKVPPARLMSESDADYLSPNNPLTQADYTLPRIVSAFYRRIQAAESSLPDGVILRIFRSGDEVSEEALELIRTQQSL